LDIQESLFYFSQSHFCRHLIADVQEAAFKKAGSEEVTEEEA
jgi:hypothetical protein